MHQHDQINQKLTIYTPYLRQADLGLEPPAQAGIQHQAYQTHIAIEQNGGVPNLQFRNSLGTSQGAGMPP